MWQVGSLVAARGLLCCGMRTLSCGMHMRSSSLTRDQTRALYTEGAWSPFFFLAVLDLHCCVWAFSSCGEWGLLFVAVLGLLIAVASLVAQHGL